MRAFSVVKAPAGLTCVGTPPTEDAPGYLCSFCHSLAMLRNSALRHHESGVGALVILEFMHAAREFALKEEERLDFLNR